MGTFEFINAYTSKVALTLLPVAGMMLIFYSAFQLWRDLRGTERKKIQQRLKEDEALKQARKIELSITKNVRSENAFYENLLRQISITQKLDRWIQQANLNLIAARFLTHLALAGLVIFFGGLILKVSIWYVLALAPSVVLLPIFVIKIMAKMRMSKLVGQLPDVFELISQALRAGHSLASGIQLIGQQVPDPAGTEFARVFYEQNLGIKLEEALTNFGDRADQLDVRFFVTAVLIQRQTGGDLAEVLDKIGSVIRERIQIMGQVKALTAEGRLSGWVLSAMPPFVFLLAWMMNPDYAGVLLYEKEGNIMLGTALFFQVVGMLIISKIVKIKV